MEEVPKLNFEEELPESQKRSKVATGILVLILLMLPVGVFITLRSNNDLRSNAATPQSSTGLESSLKLSTPKTSVNNQTVFPVDIIIRSDTTDANIFAAKLSFSPDDLTVVSIAPTNPDLADQTKDYVAQKWLESDYDNEQGVISLAAGSAPSLRTDPSSAKKAVLATIFFRSRKAGETTINFAPGLMLLKSTDGTNLLNSNPENLKLQISDSVGDFANHTYESQASAFASEQNSSPSASLALTSPIGGEVFSYNRPVTIKWQLPTPTPAPKSAKKAPPQTGFQKPTEVTVSLLMNGQFLGQLSQEKASIGEYLWEINKTLPLDYIKPENSFKIELQTDVNGVKQKVASEGPFTIQPTNNVTARSLTKEDLKPELVDLNNDGAVDLKDASFLLNQFYQPVSLSNKKADLNSDLAIDDVDLWYLKQAIHF